MTPVDNLCHTLIGAAFGEAGLKDRTRFGNPVLMIAANLPDVDALVFATGAPSVVFRRGWTHGLLAQALLPIAFTGVILCVDRLWPPRGLSRLRTRAEWLLVLSYLGVLSHVALDLLNNYGVRLLMPFSHRWFYGDAVFIVDPWLWLTLGFGILFARRRARRAPARVALTVAGAYIAAMLWSAAAARQVVRDAWRTGHEQTPRKLMVGPVPINPLRKTIIVDLDDRYETGTFKWWPHEVRFDDGTIQKREADPAVRQASRTPIFRAILRWARFPYYEIEPADGATRVTVRDLRFGARLGQASVIVSRDIQWP